MKTSEAIQYFDKSKSKLARACGLTKSAVSLWGEEVPPLRQFQLEVMTGGRLKSDFTKQRLDTERQ